MEVSRLRRRRHTQPEDERRWRGGRIRSTPSAAMKRANRAAAAGWQHTEREIGERSRAGCMPQRDKVDDEIEKPNTPGERWRRWKSGGVSDG